MDETQRQAVLDEWAARCGGSTVRNPAGYLFGIIQKALRGVQGVGGDRRSSAARAPSRGAGAIVVAFGFPSGRPRRGARLPRTAALSLAGDA